ncbi:MAG: proline--tRNA ligase [Methanobrevibacter sp.]|nr:proline--tRNA ligase [Methanobrevibacter sp.]
MENFSEWFHNILEEANITDSRYPIKGMAIWMPYGFQIRKYTLELLKELLDKDNDEVLFPMLVPEKELAKEGIHVKGFEDEVYWVTKGGQKDLNEQLALRPTSETAIYPMYSLWIRSHIDLPIKYYQIANTFRYETKHTRPLIRVREITTFKEAHTAHATKKEADEQVEDYIKLYKEFFNDLGIPYLISKRPSWDTFPGADYTMAFDTIMPDGKTLQIGTVHNLGQTFAKTFDITFEDKDGEHKYVYQTCAGLSDRVVAAMIASHGDEKGLSLPSMVSPNHVTIIPILFKKGKEDVLNKCENIKEQLEAVGLRVNIDDRDIRPGKKFYDWELKGTPIKLELGPRDLENNITIAMRRDNLEKVEIDLDDLLADNILNLIAKYDKNLNSKSWAFLEDHVKFTADLNEVPKLIEDGYVVSFNWCGDDDCGKQIEEETGYDILGIYEELDGESGLKCIKDGEDAKYVALIAKTY